MKLDQKATIDRGARCNKVQINIEIYCLDKGYRE